MSKEKKIRIYNPEYLPTYGGVVTELKEVSSILKRKAIDVEVYCDGEARDNAVINGVPVHYIQSYHPSSRWSLFQHSQQVVAHLKAQLKHITKEEKGVHWVREPFYAKAVADLFPDEPKLYVIAVVYPRMYEIAAKWGIRNRLRSWVYAPQVALLERQAIEQCVIAVPSQARRSEVASYYGIAPDEIHVVHPGIDSSLFANSQSDSNVCFTGLTVCRISPEKGIDLLLYALAKIKDKAWQWNIVGEGWLRPEMEKLSHKLGLSSKVHFLGGQDSKPFYVDADLFVLPSIYEAFGIVLLEAMASRLPCVAFLARPPEIITASEEIIVDGETGSLVKGGSIDGLAESISAFIDVPEMGRRMGQNGYLHCKKEFSWEKTASSYLSLSGLK